MAVNPLYRLRARLLDWYDRNRRPLPWRQTSDPYAVWVSEVMLQQTQVKTVLPYYARFLDRFPDLLSLARADLTSVLKAWEGLGYYARARNLHHAARQVMEVHGGRIPAAEFDQLPGVGPYIAAAVKSIAFGLPAAAVDGNVKRVLARLLEIDFPVNRAGAHSIFQTHADRFLDPVHPGRFNQALMEVGALVCRPRNPACDQCPLASGCLAFRNQTLSAFPRRDPPRKIPRRQVAVAVIFLNGRLLVTRRGPRGLLGGLWEFPGTEVAEGEAPAEALARQILTEVGLRIAVGEEIARVRHAYTHFKVEMQVFHCRCQGGEVSLNGPVAFDWVLPAGIEKYPFPKANMKFIPLLKAYRFQETAPPEEGRKEAS